jgi:hypothetical protein
MGKKYEPIAIALIREKCMLHSNVASRVISFKGMHSAQCIKNLQNEHVLANFIHSQCTNERNDTAKKIKKSKDADRYRQGRRKEAEA